MLIVLFICKYRLTTISRPFRSVEDMSLKKWKAVFKLAKRWEFSKICELTLKAIKEKLEEEDSIDAILVYHELGLDLDEGFVSVVRGLVTRAEDISEEDARRLDLTTLMRICTLRGWHARSPGSRSFVDAKICSTWNVAPIPPAPENPVNPRKRLKIRRSMLGIMDDFP